MATQINQAATSVRSPAAGGTWRLRAAMVVAGAAAVAGALALSQGLPSRPQSLQTPAAVHAPADRPITHGALAEDIQEGSPATERKTTHGATP